jgi:CRISPR-associated endonuclease/helicase Cas3
LSGALAHSPSPSGRQDRLAEHLTSVAELAAEFASVFDAGQEARAAGLSHDFGKYGPPFVERLKGKASKVDHWSTGAWVALQLLKKEGIAAALAIQGHHIGLQQASASALRELDPRWLAKNHPLGLRLSDPDVEALMSEFASDGFKMPTLERSIYEWSPRRNLGDMLDVRMLFSALVDADFLETEAHFQALTPDAKNYRQRGPSLEPSRALATLLTHIGRLAQGSSAAQSVDALRADLLTSCLDAANQGPGLFTLTAPTGAGKTLSMMAFALKHAAQHNLRRVVAVIPYLSIIDQSVKAYREAFREMGGPLWLRRYVLEHHSLAGLGRVEGSLTAKDAAMNQEGLLAENWDAPIVVTTSVQFLESLFANRPAACRKLHRLARSVILFDEVQTLPLRLIVPTLGTLSRLSER